MEFTKDIQFNNSPKANTPVTVTYSGFLKDSAELTIVYGFGENWENTTETKMQKIKNGFSANINLINSDTFNFCFRNSENQWDNNSNCNYISPILENSQSEQVEKFNIDALIEEILQPIIEQQAQPINEDTSIQINTQIIDLGKEITNILSQIEPTPTENLPEFSQLDDILSGEIVNESPIQLFETEEFSDILEDSTVETPIQNIEETQNITIENNIETSLISLEDPFTISPRKLSKFYLFRKRLKLALYKALVKIPKLIFGTQEQ